MSRRRRLLSLIAAALALTLTACSGSGGSSASAQSGFASPEPASSVASLASADAGDTDNYPSSPIRFVVASGPGGATEGAARRWQPYFEKEFGGSLMFDFVEGGGGVIGTTVVKEAAPDGYTISIRPQTNLVTARLLLGADFDVPDFDILGSFTDDPAVMMVRKDAPYDTMEEFIEYVKSKPEGTVNISLGNITDPSFLGLKQIEEATGVKFNIVGYDGGGPARLAVVSGEVEGTHTLWYGASNIWDDTKVLAVHTAVNNVPALEGIPTMNEALGYEFDDINSAYNIIAPKGFIEQYPGRAEKLMNALYAAWNNPDYLADIAAADMEGYVQVRNSEEATANTMKVSEFLENNVDKFELE